ncbi:MAG: DUF2065 domain-containing protein [Gammaproteobacteria bacterium]|jgi:hypothetical protein|nr:DUF2065 domain-containing protein [Gammaproteobacteria bacterium]MBT5216571.1 DUF2065 domain-containing protein [Gammaproteobacteria bacterium]MBT5541756.1 DUF2065 domain-containing protein [Gammaproteobacteria bacterium]MBT7754049.1 DUF2065 domain-containing protein [Gammaproteobacteria bacterium]
MGLKELFIGISFFFIFEGLIPFISPSWYKKSLVQLNEINESTLRFFGLFLIIMGVIILRFL